jgi:hypothetical protein
MQAFLLMLVPDNFAQLHKRSVCRQQKHALMKPDQAPQYSTTSHLISPPIIMCGWDKERGMNQEHS